VEGKVCNDNEQRRRGTATPGIRYAEGDQGFGGLPACMSKCMTQNKVRRRRGHADHTACGAVTYAHESVDVLVANITRPKVCSWCTIAPGFMLSDWTASDSMYGASTSDLATSDSPSVESGSCTTSGNCFMSPNYPSNYGNRQSCTIVMNSDAVLTVVAFNTESGYDKLMISGSVYQGTSGPSGETVSNGDRISWSTDSSSTRSGWKICVSSQQGSGSSNSTPSSTDITAASTYLQDCSDCPPGEHPSPLVELRSNRALVTGKYSTGNRTECMYANGANFERPFCS